MKITKIYLAGKIKSNGWRQKIFDMRNNFYGFNFYNHEKLKNAIVPFIDNVCITGPFFLSCDHSCYHGEQSHGLGVNEQTCYDNAFTEDEVIDICTTQIKRADMIIAYIDDNTCFGTLFELGMAKEMGKKVITIFDNRKREKQMWFIAKNSDYTTNLEDFKCSNHLIYNENEERLFKYLKFNEAETVLEIIYRINNEK